MKLFSKFIEEAKLSTSQRDRLDDLILNVHMTTHPEYDGNEEPTKYLNMIRKEFGDKVAKQVSDGIDKMHWGRDNHSGGHDKLAWRKGGARITKSGKMNAQDVKALKNRIKRDKAWGGITKVVKLPEALELDEKLKATDKMGTWVKDFQDSDAPQFKGKSQKKRQQMAVAAKLGAERDAGMREEVELDEVSDKRLDAYRQKAFADQPAGDDGSDKYRKRKFGRDLAFAKQTGRAKVLATKEEVELDEKAYVSSLSPELGRKGSHDVIGKDGKVVKSYPYTKQGMKLAQKHLSKMKEEVELEEAAPKMKGDWLKKERERNREHDAAMGRTPTGRKKPVRQMTSTQRSLASMRKEEAKLDEQTQYDLVEAYLLENNIDADTLSIEQLDEIIGKVIGGAFKVGAKAAVGAARRMSTAGRADAAEKRAAAAEKRNKDRERIETARQRLRDAQKAAREAKSGATT